jgi:Na+-transporting NADH:ubiquinone oxidoreductase subunit NqrC
VSGGVLITVSFIVVGLFVAGCVVALLAVIELHATLDAQRKILAETRAMLSGFFPKHIEDSLDKVPNDGQETFVKVENPWDEGKMGRD